MNEDLQQRDPNAPDDELDLKHYWEIIRKNRVLIGVCVAGAIVLAIIATVMMKPLYRSTVTLHVEPETPSAFNIDETAYGGRTDPEFLPTQIELLESRQMAERVVEKLDLVNAAAENPPESSFLSWIRGDDEEEPQVREKMVVKLAEKVQANATASPIRGTNMVEISVVSGDPDRAAQMANTLADSYIDWNMEAKFAVLGQASRFLGSQTEQLRGEIAQLERELQQYGFEKDIVTTDPDTNITMQNLEQVNRDYTTAVADRVSKEATYQELRNSSAASIADSVSGGLVTQLRNEQIKLEREYADKLNLFKPEWPEMQQLKARIDEAQRNLDEVIRENANKAREQARNNYMTALRREQSLKNVLEGRKTEARTQSGNAIEFNNLKTEIDTKRQLLDTLLARQAETNVSSRLSGEGISSVRIVDRAVPPDTRYRPSVKRNLMMGLLLGLGLGIGVAFLRDYLDRSLRSAEQVEQFLHLPAIGAIPSLQQAQGALYAYSSKKRKASRALSEEDIELLPHSKSHSTAAEAYRAVRTSLLLSRAGGLKTITVSSALPGEGKTVTSANLAVVLSQLGKKTLLIDADLHKPRLHKVFKVSNRHGVVSVLAENHDPSQYIHKTQVPHLDLITSGPTSPNPSALLSSPKMQELLDWAREHYDYIVVDTPPLSPITDAVILGTLTDGLVLAVHAGRTPREVVAAARDKLQRSNVRILGVVLNNQQLTADEYYYYASYYGEDKEASVAKAG